MRLGARRKQEQKHWGDNKDARWMRLVTRHGLKLVLDDRGTDTKDGLGKELPRANGILIKGRRSPASKTYKRRGNARGFFWEFNENDEANHTMWGSPLGQSIEMNDRYQYMMMAVSMGRGWARKWQGIKENEFIRKPMMLRDPERTAHHLKIDHDNEYIRFKTRANKGPRPDQPANQSGVASPEEHQGWRPMMARRDRVLGSRWWIVKSEDYGIARSISLGFGVGSGTSRCTCG